VAKVPDLKRITVEDFPQENQALVSKLAFPINSFMEQVRALFNKSIDFDNLAQEIVTISFTTGSNSLPLGSIQFKTTVRRARGILAISGRITNSNAFIQQMPFVNYSQNENIVSIGLISGLQPETKYEFNLLII
jgi:hypothetical protein